MKKSILEVIKNRRITCGKTQQMLANEIFTTQHTISGYETGKTMINLDRLEAICEKIDGRIEFVPNEIDEKKEIIMKRKNTNTCYLLNIVLTINDELTKEILNSERFRENFSKFVDDIWSYTGYTDILGSGIETIPNFASTKNLDFINEKTKELDYSKLNSHLKSINILKANLPKSQQTILTENTNIDIQLFNIAESLNYEAMEILLRKVHEYISEYIENVLTIDINEEYQNYEENSDWFLIQRGFELYKNFSTEINVPQTEIFIP